MYGKCENWDKTNRHQTAVRDEWIGPKNDNAIVISGSLQGEDGDDDVVNGVGIVSGSLLNSIQGLSAHQDKIGSIQTTLNK
jgi:hypothetical protein